jgi:hypothetical protein
MDSLFWRLLAARRGTAKPQPRALSSVYATAGECASSAAVVHS